MDSEGGAWCGRRPLSPPCAVLPVTCTSVTSVCFPKFYHSIFFVFGGGGCLRNLWVLSCSLEKSYHLWTETTLGAQEDQMLSKWGEAFCSSDFFSHVPQVKEKTLKKFLGEILVKRTLPSFESRWLTLLVI